MEDMIEAHQELSRTWKIIKADYEKSQQPRPTANFNEIVSSLYETKNKLRAALLRAADWMHNEEQQKEDMHPHDRELYDSIMQDIHNATTQQ